MNLPNVTNAEVVIVSAAAFLFSVVPALRSRLAKPEAAPQPQPGFVPEPIPEGIEAPSPVPPESPPLAQAPSLALPEIEPESEPEPMPIPVEAQPSATPQPQPCEPVWPQACLAAAAPADWPRFRLGDLRQARLDGVGIGVRLDAATQARLEALELAAPRQPRSFVVAAQRPSELEPVVDVLLFEELWPGGVAEAFAEVSLGQI